MAYGFRRNFGSRDFGPREMHKITCSECGKEAEVPFKPIEGKPVYCRDCFLKKKGITPRKAEVEEEAEKVEEETEEVEEETEKVKKKGRTPRKTKVEEKTEEVEEETEEAEEEVE